MRSIRCLGAFFVIFFGGLLEVKANKDGRAVRRSDTSTSKEVEANKDSRADGEKGAENQGAAKGSKGGKDAKGRGGEEWKACLQARPMCRRLPRLQIAAWYQGKKAASSLTFDDSLPTQYKTLIPLLAEVGLRGTFFLTTVDLEKAKRTVWGQSLACWPRWKAVSDAGHEIGSHTVKHPNLSKIPAQEAEEELKESCATIRRRLGPIRCDTLAYPYGISTARIRRSIAPRYYLAARGAGHAISPASPKDFYDIPSVTPYIKTPLSTLQGWLRTTLAEGRWLVWMLHGTQGQGWEALPVSTFRAIFRMLKKAEDRLWIAPFGDVARYIRLRQAIRLRLTTEAFDSPQTFELQNPLPPAFDHPLTLRLLVPSPWQALSVSFQGRSLPGLSPRLSKIPGCPCLLSADFSIPPRSGLFQVSNATAPPRIK